MPNLRKVGRDGEDAAANFLMDKGYTIVTRRFSARSGELDLVALDGDELVFVEVKVRNTSEYVPEEAVGPKKLLRLRRAADVYLNETSEQARAHRFDIIAIDQTGIRHHERVFL